MKYRCARAKTVRHLDLIERLLVLAKGREDFKAVSRAVPAVSKVLVE